MAHFINAKGSRISKTIQSWTLGSEPMTIGVWGAAGLKVGPNDPSAAQIRSLGNDKNNNTWFSLKGLRSCNVMIEARPVSGGAAWDYFQLAVVAGASGTAGAAGASAETATAGAGSTSSIQEVARGPAAFQRAFQMLGSAFPVVAHDQFGAKVIINPMTVWAGNRVLVSDVGGRVAFLIGPILYTQPTGDFIRDQYLAAMGTGGSKAAWLETVGKVELTFFTAFIGTFLGLIGFAAVSIVTVAKAGAIYAKHRNEIHAAATQLRPILADLAYIKAQCPTVFEFLRKHAPMVISPSISADDVAYFLGKLLGGIASAPEMAISVVLSSAGMALALTTVLRGPLIAVQGNSTADIHTLQERMKKEGISISDIDARALLSSPCVRDPEVHRRLGDIVRRVDQVVPVLDRLSRALRISAGV